tara:strand:+ start:16498 stop:16728 length:231 start_codon:yes stop_codon:yes gene_type:complete
MSDVIDFAEDEIEIEEDTDMNEFDEEQGMDMSDLLAQFLMEPKKQRNICEVLVDIKKQLEIQNKILAQFYNLHSKS